jgi:putative hydrolase of the HAD superfamily
MNQSGITHILFDLGNVLVELRPIETVAAMSPSLLAACAKINPIMEDFECGRITTDDFLAHAPQAFGLNMQPDELRKRFKLIVGEWYEETEPLLQALRTRYHLGCLSNTNPLHIEALRERGPHLGLLHDCFFSHETGYVKPNAEAYEHVLAAWQVAPARILFLDDRAENVDAARKIGMRAIHTFGLQAVAAACAAVLDDPLPAL